MRTTAIGARVGGTGIRVGSSRHTSRATAGFLLSSNKTPKPGTRRLRRSFSCRRTRICQIDIRQEE
jgi:hypothetical protein